MPTQEQIADEVTWINIVDTLSLVVATEYTIQNVSPDIVMLSEKATIPVEGSPFHTIGNGEWQSVTPDTGLGLWIKGTFKSVTIAITET